MSTHPCSNSKDDDGTTEKGSYAPVVVELDKMDPTKFQGKHPETFRPLDDTITRAEAAELLRREYGDGREEQ
jgi:hypothetical protein